MKKNKWLLLIISILTLGILAACSSSEDTTKSEDKTQKESAEEKVTLRVAQTGWGAHEEALKAAGLDKDLPYTVEYSVFQGGHLILEAMTAGHVDFGVTSEIPPIFSSLSANGDQTKIIGIQQSNTLQQELIVPKDSPIKSVADLKGKKVAYVQNTTAHYFLAKMLESAGLSWNDIEAQQLTPADGLTAFLGGNVDALASYGNSIITAKENGATTLASAKDILSGNFPINVPVSVIEDEKKREAVIDYLDRLNKAYAWQRENTKAWAEIVAQNTKQPVETALKTLEEGEQQRATKIIPVTEETIASQQDIANIFTQIGLIDKEVDVTPIWDRSFDEAITKLNQ